MIFSRLDRFVIITIISGLSLFFSTNASSKPGPVVIGMMERVESHSKAYDMDYYTTKDYDSATYLTSVLFVSRKLDDKVSSMLTYINRYDAEDGTTATNIGAVSLFPQISPHWRGTISYTYVSNPERGVTDFLLSRSSSNWLIEGMDYISDPEGGRRSSWEAGLSFNSTTDFTKGRMLIVKVGNKLRTSDRTYISATAETILGFKGGATDTAKQEVIADRYSASFIYRIDPANRITLESIYQDNTYTGNPGDDLIFRIGYIRLFKMK